MSNLTIQEVASCPTKEGAVSFAITLAFHESPAFKIYKKEEELYQFFAMVAQKSELLGAGLRSDGEQLTAESITKMLNCVLEVLGDGIWMHLDIMAFFDESTNQSTLTRLHLAYLTKQLSMMQRLTLDYEKRIAAVEQKYSEVAKNAPLSENEVNTFISKSTISSIPHADSKDQTTTASNISSLGSSASSSTKKGPELRSDSSYHSSEESQHSDSSDSENEGNDTLEATRQKQLEEATSKQAESIAESLVRLEEGSLKIHDEVGEMLKFVTPTEQNCSFANTMFNFLRGQTRLSVNSSLFGIGLSEIGCNLPDDVIEYSVLLSKNHFPTWHTSLCERLIAVSEGSVEAWADNSDFNPTVKVADVKFSADDSSSTSFAVFCSIDESKVVISSNKRHDLCMVAFLEEVSTLVGKNVLFKRALLLIRAWWNYETATYVDREVKHYLSDNVICTMICMVFNKYHWRIDTPQQALLFFLAEFCQYNSKQHVITLQGIVNFQANSRSPLQLIPPHPRHLITFEILEKYWHLFNVGAANQSPQLNPVFSSQMMNDNMTKTQFNPYQTNTIVSFDRVGFNVLHPFTHMSMVSERLSSRRVALISKVFLLGATNLATNLKQVVEMGHANGNFSANFFPNLILKFSPAYQSALLRHDNLRSAFDGNLLHYVAEKIWQNILHCNFVLESVITESAILTASMENLSVKGPLPVGEVGKMLTEVSCMPQLSLHLKEKFGGLKKFLEKFPEIFVYSNDHPFNPHVLLRSSLLPEHQKMIYRGVIPMQVMSQYKKSSSSKKSVMTHKQPNQDVYMSGSNGPSQQGFPNSHHPDLSNMDTYPAYAHPGLNNSPAMFPKAGNYMNPQNSARNPPPAVPSSYPNYPNFSRGDRDLSYNNSHAVPSNHHNKFTSGPNAMEPNDQLWSDYQASSSLNNRGPTNNGAVFGSNNASNPLVANTNRNEFSMVGNRFSLDQPKDEFYRDGHEMNAPNSSSYLQFPPSNITKERTSSNDFAYGRFDSSMDSRFH